MYGKDSRNPSPDPALIIAASISNTILEITARLHVSTGDRDTLRAAIATVGNLETCKPRDLFYYCAGAIRAQRRNAARYTVSLRAIA